MEKDFFKNEIRKMFQFHKSVLLLIFKAFLCACRYGLWLLPWIFLAVFVWKPMLAGWKVFTQGAPGTGAIRRVTLYESPYGGAVASGKSPDWETIQSKVDSGVRSFERISRRIREN